MLFLKIQFNFTQFYYFQLITLNSIIDLLIPNYLLIHYHFFLINFIIQYYLPF